MKKDTIPFVDELEDDLLERGWEAAQGPTRRGGNVRSLRFSGATAAMAAFVAVLILVGLPWVVRGGSPLRDQDGPAGAVAGTPDQSAAVRMGLSTSSPNAGGGEVWRLIATVDGSIGRAPKVIADADMLGRLWTSLLLEGDPPPIDFNEEVVVTFEGSTGGGDDCPQPEPFGVAITASNVRAVTYNPSIVDSECYTVYRPRTFVAALSRAALPAPTFEISAQNGAHTVVSGDLRSPGSTPGPSDVSYVNDI